MTTQELRELDAWIAEHVMGWKRVDTVLQIWEKGQFATNSEFKEPPRVIIYEGYSRVQSWSPTERGSDAMDVLKKCAEKEASIIISKWHDTWVVGATKIGTDCCKSTSLEEAICMTAKQLFSQTTK